MKVFSLQEIVFDTWENYHHSVFKTKQNNVQQKPNTYP